MLLALCVDGVAFTKARAAARERVGGGGEAKPDARTPLVVVEVVARRYQSLSLASAMELSSGDAARSCEGNSRIVCYCARPVFINDHRRVRALKFSVIDRGKLLQERVLQVDTCTVY